MPRVDPKDPRPPYQQIASDLRRAIEAGELEAGERLASTRELAVVYGVAPMTVHQAVRVLRDEGLVDSFQGRGVFIRTSLSGDREPDLSGQIEDIRQQVNDLVGQVPSDVQEQLADIRRRLGLLEAHLMDLYARTGQQYPHEQASPGKQSDEANERRMSSA